MRSRPGPGGGASTSLDGLRGRIARGETLFGTFLNMGSPVAAEICGRAGFDWLVVDLEHGSGSEADLLHQLQAFADTAAHALVRVEANERPRFTKALDLGADGIMVPRVETAEEAARAAAHARYPPAGVRGVAFMNRAYGFGSRARDLEAANRRVVCVVQIESETAVGNAGAIAAVDGVDALFIGPNDLTQSMGILGRTDDSRYVAAVDAVARAVEAAGKAAGVLIRRPEELDGYRDRGFRLIGISGDGAFLAGAAREALAALRAR